MAFRNPFCKLCMFLPRVVLDYSKKPPFPSFSLIFNFSTFLLYFYFSSKRVPMFVLPFLIVLLLMI